LAQLQTLEDRGAPAPMIGNNRAIVFILQGALEQAAEHLERVLALYPEDPEATANLALVQSRRGQVVAAREVSGETEQAGQRGEEIELLLEELRWKK